MMAAQSACVSQTVSPWPYLPLARPGSVQGTGEPLACSGRLLSARTVETSRSCRVGGSGLHVGGSETDVTHRCPRSERTAQGSPDENPLIDAVFPRAAAGSLLPVPGPRQALLVPGPAGTAPALPGRGESGWTSGAERPARGDSGCAKCRMGRGTRCVCAQGERGQVTEDSGDLGTGKGRHVADREDRRKAEDGGGGVRGQRERGGPEAAQN